ncbi:F-box/kelch-repeat protein At3g23880-like [Quercus robur]|uniref:F-box/kelch-repeat protein At3g23880-like n=1 Tax=Quercus robur TaxID=38942 RepID=UPI002162EA93|nr:F-box/kelch-repeat protein At3g23880-like [Quercus robur]
MSQIREPAREQPPTTLRRQKYIHYSIVLNILARLPVKSLLRFRCVCKSWDSLITSPYFISTHLYINNVDRGDYIVNMPWYVNPSSPPYSNRPVITFYCDHDGFDKIFEFEIPSRFPPYQANLVGSCNGLLCLEFQVWEERWQAASKTAIIYLWNPSIRKLKRLPDIMFDCFFDCFIPLGFAYHSEDNDYKVVKISYYSRRKLEVEVYTSKSDSWRTLEDLDVSLRPKTDDFGFHFSLPIPFFGGALHWLVDIIQGEEKHKTEMILSFDVNNETFEELAVPDRCFDGAGNEFDGKCISLFRGKLALIRLETVGEQSFACVWAIKEYGKHKSWNKPLVVREQYDRFYGLTKRGFILLEDESHISGNGQLEMQKKRKLVLIDPEARCEECFDFQDISFVATFMESLALLDEANVITY